MKTTIKTKLKIASYLVLVGIIAVQYLIIKNPDHVVTVAASDVQCAGLEDSIRNMDSDQLNKLMIVMAETFTAHYKDETRAQVEEEHKRYANRLALEHMNNVMGVLVKSIGAMPTSTLPVNN